METLTTNRSTVILDDLGRWVTGYGQASPDVGNPHVGARYFDTDDQKEYFWTGSAWSEVESNPNFNTEYWEDLRFPPSGLNPAGPGNPPDVDNDNGGIFLYSATADEVCGGAAQMPHAWKSGSAIYPHVHWAPTDAAAGNVYWRLGYKIVPIGGDIPAAFTVSNILIATPLVAGRHVISSFPSIDMTGQKVSTMVLFYVMRPGLTEATDTYAGQDVHLLEFDIHYQVEKTGTVTQFP